MNIVPYGYRTVNNHGCVVRYKQLVHTVRHRTLSFGRTIPYGTGNHGLRTKRMNGMPDPTITIFLRTRDSVIEVPVD